MSVLFSGGRCIKQLPCWGFGFPSLYNIDLRVARRCFASRYRSVHGHPKTTIQSPCSSEEHYSANSY